MEKVKPDLNEIAATVTGWFPKLTPEEQRLSLQLYRMLAAGAPAAPEDVAKSLDMEGKTVKEILQRWPGVYYDDGGRVQGYWGLAIPKMGHRFEVDGKTLYAWCAWDTLFMPELIGKTAEVESTCPVTKETVRLTVAPNGIANVEPEDVAVSFLLPDESTIQKNVVTNFCHFIYFFNSNEAADKWIADHPGTFRLSLDEAFNLGKLKNHIQYGDVLGQ